VRNRFMRCLKLQPEEDLTELNTNGNWDAVKRALWNNCFSLISVAKICLSPRVL
jgi:hypothetical protein